MKKIVGGICEIHGQLNDEIGYFEKTKNGNLRLRCRQCKRDNSKKWREKNHDYHLAKVKQWRSENRERINTKLKEDRKNNPEKFRTYERKKREQGGQRYKDYYIKQRFGIEVSEYYEMSKKQDDKCYICREPETRVNAKGELTKLAVDHCHESEKHGIMKIRKLLCHGCNTALGKLKERIDLFERCIEYLKEHNGTTRLT